MRITARGDSLCHDNGYPLPVECINGKRNCWLATDAQKKRGQMLLRAESISDFGGESDISRSDKLTSI
jgi:hypothetical protein